MRTIPQILAMVVLLAAPALAAQTPPSAEQVLGDAKVRAAELHKNIFLVFEATWCAPCKAMTKFLEARETRPILEKYFVIAALSILEELGKKPELNSPGADKLAADLGGKSSGVPFFVFLNERGQPIVSSNRPGERAPGGGNIGYPVTPQEIEWFMSMLKKSVPALTGTEARVIESWLQAAARG
jgi:thiol-disulfide isomerase/thioredoxin